jgi:hypothetical protein
MENGQGPFLAAARAHVDILARVRARRPFPARENSICIQPRNQLGTVLRIEATQHLAEVCGNRMVAERKHVRHRIGGKSLRQELGDIEFPSGQATGRIREGLFCH